MAKLDEFEYQIAFASTVFPFSNKKKMITEKQLGVYEVVMVDNETYFEPKINFTYYKNGIGGSLQSYIDLQGINIV